MMITTPREADFTTKQESDTVDTEKNYSKPSSSITSTPWTRLRDPRIVRVSRAFGGKDRHSKVCTVKGLRDRRVRLSVPTAIQLYDLQERLGLGQPSKVVDWLLNAAKNDIDELPPLQIPIGNFGQNIDDQLLLNSSDKDSVMMINSVSREANYWNSDKSKEVNATDRSIPLDEKENWNRTNDEEGGEEEEAEAAAAEDVSSNKFFPRSNYHSSIPGLLNNVVPHNSNYRWDPSIFSLSHFTPQTENHLHNFNVVQLPSPVPLSLPSGSQVLVCPTGTTQPYFPSHLGTNNSVGFDPKQINHYQMLSSTSQNPSFSSSMRPFQLSMAANLLPSQSGSGSQSNNDDEFSPIS